MVRAALLMTLALLAGCGAEARPEEEPGYAESGAYERSVRMDAALGQEEPPGASRPFLMGEGDEGDRLARGPQDQAPPQPANAEQGENGQGNNGQGGNGQGGNGQGGSGQGNNGQGGNGQGAAGDPQAPSTPLLIYTAELHLAVHEVESTQRAVVTIAKELGGFLAYQDDSRVTVRVPAKRFQDAIEKLERVGDVTHRNIQAQDVTEEFRDVSIRLRNAEVVRARLEEILTRAEKVEDALKVQAELGRVTETIETLKGRLRFLQDRIAFSTITVIFQPRPTEQIGQPEVYRLPFSWLDELGLPALLNLR